MSEQWRKMVYEKRSQNILPEQLEGCSCHLLRREIVDVLICSFVASSGEA